MQVPVICCTCDAREWNSLHKITDRLDKYPDKMLSDLLKELTNIEMPAAYANRLPQCLCGECARKLKNAYEFVTQARTANKLLMENLHKGETVAMVAPYYLQQTPPPPVEICNDQQSVVKEEYAITQFSVVADPLEMVDETDSDVNESESHFSEEESLGDDNQYLENENVIKKFLCAQCGKSFKKRSTLCEHMKRHNLFSCDICERAFSRTTNLRRHKKAVHNIDNATKIIPTLSCNLCGKKFVSSSGLKTHMRLHTDDRLKYDCDMCERAFSRRNNLERHRRIIHKANISIIKSLKSGKVFQKS